VKELGKNSNATRDMDEDLLKVKVLLEISNLNERCIPIKTGKSQLK